MRHPARLCPECYQAYILGECPHCHPPIVASALAQHLRELYPHLGIRPTVDVVNDPDQGGYVHISSKRGAAILLYGSKVFLTRMGRGATMSLPRGYIPDIDLCEPDALDRIYRWLNLWQNTDDNNHS